MRSPQQEIICHVTWINAHPIRRLSREQSQTKQNPLSLFSTRLSQNSTVQSHDRALTRRPAAEIGIILLQGDFANLERGTGLGGLRHILLTAEEGRGRRALAPLLPTKPGTRPLFRLHCTGTRGLRRATGVSGRASERDVISEGQCLPWAVHARGFYRELCLTSRAESVVPLPDSTYATVRPAWPADVQTCLGCADSVRWYTSWKCRACAPGTSSLRRGRSSCRHLK